MPICAFLPQFVNKLITVKTILKHAVKKNGQYLSLAIFCPKTFLQMSRPKMQSGSGQDQMWPPQWPTSHVTMLGQLIRPTHMYLGGGIDVLQQKIHNIFISDPAYLVVWVKKPNYLVWLVTVPRPVKGMRKRWKRFFSVKIKDFLLSRFTIHLASATLSLRVLSSPRTRKT